MEQSGNGNFQVKMGACCSEKDGRVREQEKIGKMTNENSEKASKE